MGTRADFYVGTGENAEWLGSVAWDGYEWQKGNNPLMLATTEEEFRAAVKQISEEREDWTAPEQGWPWPWKNSFTTDRAYAFVDGMTRAYEWGKESDETEESIARTTWPDMTSRQKVTYGPRSGLLVFGMKK